MSAYEYHERFILWQIKGNEIAKLSHVIATAGGMKKQGGAKFKEHDFDQFAPLVEVESAESIDSTLSRIRSAHKKQ